MAKITGEKTNPMLQWSRLQTDGKLTTSAYSYDDAFFYSPELEKITEIKKETLKDEKIEPEGLYRPTLDAEVVSEVSQIFGIRDIIQNAIDLLSNALPLDDEIERECELNLFTELIFVLSAYIRINKNFKDAICLVQTAVIAHIKNIYSRPQIVALQKVLSLMRNNIFMNKDVLNDCVDILEDAEFDINAPLSEVELNI